MKRLLHTFFKNMKVTQAFALLLMLLSGWQLLYAQSHYSASNGFGCSSNIRNTDGNTINGSQMNAVSVPKLTNATNISFATIKSDVYQEMLSVRTGHVLAMNKAVFLKDNTYNDIKVGVDIFKDLGGVANIITDNSVSDYGFANLMQPTAFLPAGIDSDGDGITDDIDIDDDNDGVLDVIENPICGKAVYNMDVASTSYTGFSTDGGYFELNYKLQSGTAVPSIGNSFKVRVDYSDFNNLLGIDNKWEGATTNTTYAGVRPNMATLYTGLPSKNLAAPAYSGFPDVYYRGFISSGTFNTLGTFTVSIGVLPNPLGYQITNQAIRLYSHFSAAGSAIVGLTSGYYAKMQFQTIANTTGIPQVAGTLPYNGSYGQTYTYDYLAHNKGGATGNQGRGLFAIDQGTVTFSGSCNYDLDNDGIINSLDLDSDGDGCSDAYEAGTTTNTTKDYAHPGPYGANGFVNAKETAVESGVYSGAYTYINAITAGTGCKTDLSLTVSPLTQTANKGEIVTYTYTLANGTLFSSDNVAVRISIPAGLTYLTSTATQGSYDNSTKKWTLGTVAGNTTQTLIVKAKVN